MRRTASRLTRLSETTRGIAVNGLLSWTVLPLVLPPFRLYYGRELVEVLLWQGMGLVGWPVGWWAGWRICSCTAPDFRLASPSKSGKLI